MVAAALLFGGTQNYLVTREFKEISTAQHRVELLDCQFAVSAADTVPIPGFNAGGDHTPLLWLAPAAASTALAVHLATRRPTS